MLVIHESNPPGEDSDGAGRHEEPWAGQRRRGTGGVQQEAEEKDGRKENEENEAGEEPGDGPQ